VSVKGSSPFISTDVFSYGATVARLILVQKIVVRIHVGKLWFWESISDDFGLATRFWWEGRDMF
jgi:hypothetical protein